MGVLGTAFAEGLRPPEIVTVSQWADVNRILAQKASSEPGRWRTDRAPYLREIMDILSLHDPTKKVVIMKASQVGVSEAVINAIGHTITYNPSPILVIYPVEALAKKMARNRFDTMVTSSPALNDLVSAQKGRDAKNTVLEKDFVGGTISFGGASSPNSLSSVSARVLACDEVDRMPLDVSSEGDPLFLATQRTAAFPRFKIVFLSTPTTVEESIISNEFEDSDKRYYLVPCPHCGLFQELRIEGFRYEVEDRECVDAWFECESCHKRIEETDKPDMLTNGQWTPTQESPIAGFHISQFYMPLGWKSWRAIGWNHFQAIKDKEKMVAFFNTVLGLPWADRSEKPSWEDVYERREDFPIGKFPSGVLFLTAGVDVQGDRIEMQVVGWGADKASWSIDYQIHYGDTDSKPVWDKLWEALDAYYPSEDGRSALPIQVAGVDTGYRTERVYEFLRAYNQPDRVIAVKGDDRIVTPIGRPSIVEVDGKGRSFKRGLHLWPVGVDHLKTNLYDRLTLRKDPETGEHPSQFCHFPQFEPEFFKQLTAESKRVKATRSGRKIRHWVKDYERNEVLDTWVYARACASKFGIDRFSESDWNKIRNSIVGSLSSTEPVKQSTDVGRRKIKIKPRKESKFW